MGLGSSHHPTQYNGRRSPDYPVRGQMQYEILRRGVTPLKVSLANKQENDYGSQPNHLFLIRTWLQGSGGGSVDAYLLGSITLPPISPNELPAQSRPNLEDREATLLGLHSMTFQKR